jgi:hypothetical protein
MESGDYLDAPLIKVRNFLRSVWDWWRTELKRMLDGRNVAHHSLIN